MKTPRTSPTEVIHADGWPEGETVTIHTFLSGWDGARLRAEFRKLAASDATRDGGPDAELLAYEQALCMALWGVVSTTLTFADGSPVTPTVDDYKRLEDTDLQYIVGQFSDRLAAWSRTPAAAPGEEADAAGFQPSPGGRPADAEGDHGAADGGGDARRPGGGPAATDVPGELGHDPVDVSHPA